MTDIEDVLKESKEMMKRFYSDTDEEKENIKRIKNNEELRESVSNFVVNQFDSISKTDKLRSLVEAEILRKVAMHELDNTELKELYKTISQQKTYHVDSVLKLFAPTQSTSPIITPATATEESENLQLTSEERNTIEKVRTLLEAVEKKKMEKNNEI